MYVFQIDLCLGQLTFTGRGRCVQGLIDYNVMVLKEALKDVTAARDSRTPIGSSDFGMAAQH